MPPIRPSPPKTTRIRLRRQREPPVHQRRAKAILHLHTDCVDARPARRGEERTIAPRDLRTCRRHKDCEMTCNGAGCALSSLGSSAGASSKLAPALSRTRPYSVMVRPQPQWFDRNLARLKNRSRIRRRSLASGTSHLPRASVDAACGGEAGTYQKDIGEL